MGVRVQECPERRAVDVPGARVVRVALDGLYNAAGGADAEKRGVRFRVDEEVEAGFGVGVGGVGWDEGLARGWGWVGGEQIGCDDTRVHCRRCFAGEEGGNAFFLGRGERGKEGLQSLTMTPSWYKVCFSTGIPDLLWSTTLISAIRSCSIAILSTWPLYRTCIDAPPPRIPRTRWRQDSCRNH